MIRISGTLPRRARPVASTVRLAGTFRTLRRLRPDLIFVYRYWDVPLAVAIGAATNTPVALCLCLPPPDHVPRWLKASLAHVDQVLAVSADTARRWEGLGPTMARTSVVLTGIDMAHFVPGSDAERAGTRSTLGVSADAYLVLYAGRIGREKGVDLLLQACDRVAPVMPELHIAVAGGPSLGADPDDSDRYAAELHHLADGLPVRWLGLVSEVAPLLQAADVAVVPSRWPEPLARSVIEPLACGVPVVATNVGGSSEVLTDSLSRFLVPPDDANALATALTSLRGWRRRDPGLGARCRQAVEERFSLERETDDTEAALVALRARRTRRG